MEKKRKVLIATSDASMRDALSDFIKSKIPQAMIIPATDGNEALFKVSNDTPHIVFADGALPKVSGTKVAEWIINEKKDAHVATIIISKIPDKELFVDQVVTGKVQFLEDVANSEKLTEVLARAVRVIMSGEKLPFQTRKLAANELLIKEGEKAASVFIVKKGKLKAYLVREQEELLGLIEAGEFVGEMAYINGELRSANVAAVEDCELIEIPIPHLDRMLFQKPAWARALMKTLSKRVKVANQKTGVA